MPAHTPTRTSTRTRHSTRPPRGKPDPRGARRQERKRAGRNPGLIRRFVSVSYCSPEKFYRSYNQQNAPSKLNYNRRRDEMTNSLERSLVPIRAWQQQSASNPTRACATSANIPDQRPLPPARGSPRPVCAIAHQGRRPQAFHRAFDPPAAAGTNHRYFYRRGLRRLLNFGHSGGLTMRRNASAPRGRGVVNKEK